MSSKLWFKRKRYGWGWYPASSEGWLITLLYVILLVILEVRFIKEIEYQFSLIRASLYFLLVVLLIGSLIYICYKKGEKPRWSWGE